MTTIDEMLREQGYRPIATLHRTELFDRAVNEIPDISNMDYYIIPVDIALNDSTPNQISQGLHYVYVKEK